MNRQLINRVMLVAIVGVIALWTWFLLYSGLRTVPHGVRLGEWSIGGMREEQYKLELRARLALLYSEPIRLQLAEGKPGEATFTLGQLGMSANEDQLSRMADYLFEGSKLSKAKRRWRMRNAVVPLELKLSDEPLRQSLQSVWPERLNPPVKNAERIVTADDRIEYIPEQGAWAIDTKRLTEQLVAVGYERFKLAAQTKSDQPSHSSAAIQIPMREQLPDVTQDMLKSQGVSRKIAEYTTTFPGSVAGRVHNIQVTAAAIHDKLLAPGERFDYSTIIRATEQKAGYREAPVIFNGKLVPGIGGGICQVSTTLYNAVLLAGLQVNERRNHSLPVSYVPLGLDATYANGYINFMFTNNSGHYILIRTETDDSRVTVKLFGTIPESVAYAIETNVLQTLEPSVKYVRNPTLPAGEQSVLQQGKPGYVVESFRIRKENGVVVSKELLSKDKYEPQPTLIAVRGSDSPPDGKDGPRDGVRSIIEDGVSGPVFRNGR